MGYLLWVNVVDLFIYYCLSLAMQLAKMCKQLKRRTIELRGRDVGSNQIPLMSLLHYLFKMCQTRPLFVHFRSFHMTNIAQIQYMKKRKWLAWDSNPGWHVGRRRQIHWVMAATHSFALFTVLKSSRQEFKLAPRAQKYVLVKVFKSEIFFFLLIHSFRVCKNVWMSQQVYATLRT